MLLGEYAKKLLHIVKFKQINYQLIAYFIFVNILLILANTPYLYRDRHLPPNTIPIYMHQNVVMDFPGYINFIRQGKEEHTWSVKDLYTTETTTPSKLYIYFVLLGKIALIFHLDPTFTYHLIRIVQFEIFSGSIYLLCSFLLGNNFGFWAAILSFMATPPVSLFGYVFYGRNDLGIPSWWMLNPFRRIDMLPHHEASAILLIFEIFLVLKSLKKSNIRLNLLAGVAAFFSTIFHPISVMVYLVAQPLVAIIYVIFNYIRSRKLDLSFFWIFFIPFIFTGVAAIIIKFVVSNTYPFNLFPSFEVVWYDRYTTYIRDYFIGGGITLLIGIPIAIWLIIKSKDISWILIACWAIISYLLIPLSTTIGIAKFRFALLLPYLPLTILIVKQVQIFWNNQSKQKYKIIGNALLVGFYLVLTIPSVVIMFQDWRNQMQVIEPGMYRTQDVDNAITFIKAHAPIYSRILSGEINGMLIPAYAPVITYVGQYGQTVNFEDKKTVVRLFYKGYYQPNEARTILKDNNINYIFFSPEEKIWGPGPEIYGFPLEVWYKNSTVTIYQVPDNL
jgi:hypothetical protein